MPNTKSAERRMRNSARKHARNRGAEAKIKTLEQKYASLIQAGKKEEAATALRAVSSALDKAAKTGAVHYRHADRKKSRLADRLNAVK